ncbi:motile sperm domain-containing protein 3 isoform X2 [Zalophus californianus]|nr:motile sperm domain-containing protein 3 isoform X2 [Zalophus californianus]
MGRCSDENVSLTARAAVRRLRHDEAARRAQGEVGGTDKALDSRPCPLSSALVCPPSTACMRRGAPQDQELVGPGAPGRGSRGAPPPSGLVPVLVFPPDLVFRADQRSGPRQLLTLYNPTGAALRFRVLCTAPAKYTVFDAEGYVKPQSCIDIVIRHVAPIPSHYDVQDRFRIELSEEGAEGRVVGRKDITSVLRAPAYPLELQGQPDPTPHPGPPSWTAPPTARHFPENHPPQLATSSFLLFLLTGIVSVAFLLLPLQDELGSQLPQILHVSLGQKLVAAYILGLLTMVFLRT